MTCANHPDREHVAFCQNCGKPLCKECTRVVGQAVFCEPCLAARLAGAPGAVNYPPGTEGSMPPPIAGAPPSPLVATLLGIIPGVGAMYNGQYAKGIIHLVVFAVLVTLSDNASDIFGLFVAGWVIYQIIDANHTARARLAGTPLPNPFGLNDIGERFGFGKAWPAAAPYPPATPPPASTATTTTPPADPYGPFTPPASSWGAPPESYAVPPGPAMPYTAPYPADDPNAYPPPARNYFPAGAIWLIGLGVFFLVANMFRRFPFHLFMPFLLIGLGIWLFFRRMMNTGPTLTDDGTPAYRYRLISALRGSIWVILVGVIFLLSNFTRYSWGHVWPLFIIVAGVMMLLERSAAASAYTSYPYPPAPPPPEPATPATTTSIAPVNPLQNDARENQEGR
jgi:TM2 domain-containing membrane protein YozV